MSYRKIFCAAALSVFLTVPALSAGESAPAEVAAAPEVPANAEKNPSAECATQISRVIVFPSGARVTRSAEISLRAGVQEILLAGTPKNLFAGTLTAETTAPGSRVLSVAVEHRACASSPTLSAEFAAAREKRDRAVAEHVALANRHAEAVARLRALDAFKPFGATQKNRASNEIAAEQDERLPFPLVFDANTALRASAFLKNAAEDASKEVVRLKRALDAAGIEREIAEDALRKLQAEAQEETAFVRVRVAADAPCAGTLSLNYFVENAQWRPSYDIVVDPAAKSATLVSYGIIQQTSGENWDGVPVTLSTADVSEVADLPEFQKIFITERFRGNGNAFVSAFSSSGSKNSKKNVKQSFLPQALASAPAVLSNASANRIALKDGREFSGAQDIRYFNGNYVFKKADGALAQVAAADVAGISQNYKETQAGAESVPASKLRNPAYDLRGLDFRRELVRAEMIPASGTPRRCLIGSETYAGDFYLQLAPASDENAYRMLAVTNRDFRPILAGPANIFYGADFIGETQVPYTLRDGSVRIPLGADPRVAVKRKVVNKIETVGTFSKSRRKTVEVSVKIDNRTPEKIRLVCDEAVPVSALDKIEVSSPEFSPETKNFDEKTGLATRVFSLDAEQKIELKTKYSIDYPENFALRERVR